MNGADFEMIGKAIALDKRKEKCPMDMKEYINKYTIPYFARTNEEFLKKPVKGILLEFPGLDGGSCLGGRNEVGTYDGAFAVECGQKGIILAYVFTGPWSWMNEGAVRTVDAVVDALQDKYDLEEIPIVPSGGSMGGLGAIIYSCRSRHKIKACCAACPCCDVLDRYDAHPEFPRTFIRAVAGYDCESLSEAMKTLSPMHCIDELPFIPYFLANCCEDEVFPEEQLDSFVEMLLDKGHDVEYVKMPGKLHGEFTEEGLRKLRAFQVKWFE